MFKISKVFAFEASHQLTGMPAGHPCARNHGHSYVVRVDLMAEELDELGMVTDYHNLAPVKEWIDKNVDHQFLNDVFPGMHTTAENMAEAIFAQVRSLMASFPGFDKQWWVECVAVSETAKTWAEFHG